MANTSGGSNVYGYDAIPADGKTASDSGGNDLLIGPHGSTLIAGQGNDTLWAHGGGSNLDGSTVANTATTFYFQTTNDGGDNANNFDSASGQADVIAVSAAGFGGGLVSGQNVSSIFESSNSNAFTSSSDRFHFDTGSHGLYYSANGTTASEVLLATVTNHTVTANDIHVVA